MSIRPENRHQAFLLARLRDMGAISRAELGDAVKLSRSQLAVELDRLIDLRLIEDGGLAASRGGRRSTIVRLSSQLRFVGIDIGATSVDVAITDAELKVIAHASEAADVRQGPDVVLAVALELVDKLRAEGIAPEIHGAGVGVPGPVSFRDGVPVAPPIMPGWDQFPVRSVLSQHLGAPVLVDNDVNIMALGERHAGLSRKVDDFLFVKIGTGVGCGIVVGGNVYRGVSGSAGDIGHIRIEDEGPLCACGNTGCLEASSVVPPWPGRRWQRPEAASRSSSRAAPGGRHPRRLRRCDSHGGRRPGRHRDGPRRRSTTGLPVGRPGELLQPGHGRHRR